MKNRLVLTAIILIAVVILLVFVVQKANRIERVQIDENTEKLIIKNGEYDLYSQIRDTVLVINLRQKEEFCFGWAEGKEKLSQKNYKIVIDKDTHKIADFAYYTESIRKKREKKEIKEEIEVKEKEAEKTE